MTEDPSRADVAARVHTARARIRAAAVRAGRDPASVALLAVTKTASPAQVVAAVAAGVTDVGENRVADAEARMRDVARLVAAAGATAGATTAAGAAARGGAPDLATAPGTPSWHFIGHLQSNKARRAVAAFDRIDALDSVALAERLSVLAVEAGRTLPVLLEVNIARDPGRSGFAPEDVAAAAERVLALGGLRVDGLMGIAPFTPDAAVQRRAFALLASLRAALSERYPTRAFPVLSMGMTDDFEVAIQAGSTEVRLGRALFAAEG